LTIAATGTATTTAAAGTAATTAAGADDDDFTTTTGVGVALGASTAFTTTAGAAAGAATGVGVGTDFTTVGAGAAFSTPLVSSTGEKSSPIGASESPNSSSSRAAWKMFPKKKNQKEHHLKICQSLCVIDDLVAVHLFPRRIQI
jgi:hypothetical protein